ncbi:GNAT family N-acetyltransferase [Runella sp. CRIBMP]|uniref:GNAT family N-acetyltransferase n=1 Tax=Runella sp. CRIBMP TaxID=2683261 RepID=UPI0014136911|nr:GNAT family N-acetyltransferase [Runella sp. CRIBMP]NBB18985.1 GNAT family N-acetyltransferase [Runella sp. CRIBMP]
MPDNIRFINKDDLEDLKSVIETSGLFPPYLLAGMLSDFFDNSETQDIWLTKVINEKPIAITYCAPERLTSGTYNLYLIAVHKDFQGKGIGGELMNYIETLLKSNGNRILIVETSGLPEFELTRKFYENKSYNREAVIRDFYNEGEDKVVFWKKLT